MEEGKTDELSGLSKTKEEWNLKASLSLFSSRLAREEHMAVRNGRTDGRAGRTKYIQRVVIGLLSREGSAPRSGLCLLQSTIQYHCSPHRVIATLLPWVLFILTASTITVFQYEIYKEKSRKLK